MVAPASTPKINKSYVKVPNSGQDTSLGQTVCNIRLQSSYTRGRIVARLPLFAIYDENWLEALSIINCSNSNININSNDRTWRTIDSINSRNLRIHHLEGQTTVSAGNRHSAQPETK